MKKIKMILLLLVLCVLCGCSAAPAETQAPTEVMTEAATEAPTEAPTEPPTEAPTEPVADRVRDMIRDGDYEGALALLETEPETEETDLLRLRAQLGDVKIGDTVTFGRYEQDAEEGNGPEEIQWVVLTTQDEKAFLLSRYCLDTKPYHNVIDGKVTWAESALRSWLNEDFHNAVFTETEQLLLTETELTTSDNPRYGTPGGADTVDRVFLLSLEEVEIYLDQELKKGQTTPFAQKNGCYDNAVDYGWWWLRSPGKVRRDACYVDASGKASLYGYVVHRSGWSVRPAIWIDLSV